MTATAPKTSHSPRHASWLAARSAGLLLHPTSLPGSQGIGVLDAHARELLDFLHHAGISEWQVCPLGPTGFGDSPYQCFSSFAGNPYLIDLDPLIRAGLLSAAEVAPLTALPKSHVDYGALYRLKWPLLFAAHARWSRDPLGFTLPYGDFSAFRHENASWLESYCRFSAFKAHFGGRPWWEWPAAVSSFTAAEKSPLRRELASQIEAHAFIQFIFAAQWRELRAEAERRGIRIVGDVPIFTALDSADVWASPHLFQLDPRTRRPTFVAGVPPDYFSADGQLWGNPLYDWSVHAAEGYAWWLSRLRANFARCDIVRLDHFRGFEAYWAVPAGAPTARTGSWVPGPGIEFFQAVARAIPTAKLIAEDLGLLTPATVALREATGLPGMAVLQFAFGGEADNPYLPHNHQANTVVYAGTHDNDTSLGWYATADEKTRDHVRRYFRISGQEIGWDFVRAAYGSVANLAVVSLPDLLSLDSAARFNTPGRSQGNWGWRYQTEQLRALGDNSGEYLRSLGLLYGRSPSEPKSAKE